MKLILFTLLSTIFFSEINAQTKYINPTGEYKLKSKIKILLSEINIKSKGGF